MQLTKRVADLIAIKILQSLASKGFITLPQQLSFEGFHHLRNTARTTFFVPKTSITPVMSRVLYGLAFCHKPKTILCIGSYVGTTLLWLLGPFITKANQRTVRAYGIDVDKKAINIARKNFTNIGYKNNIMFICGDGHDIPNLIKQKIDLVFLDVEDKKKGKSIYSSILEKIYPQVEHEGLVLAHDISVPKFKRDLREYLCIVHDTHAFSSSVHLDIDYCGLEVSKKI